MKSAQENFAYSVWVGDGEVNENYINELKEAREIARSWESMGYDDVAIEKVWFDPHTGDVVKSRWVK